MRNTSKFISPRVAIALAALILAGTVIATAPDRTQERQAEYDAFMKSVPSGKVQVAKIDEELVLPVPIRIRYSCFYATHDIKLLFGSALEEKKFSVSVIPESRYPSYQYYGRIDLERTVYQPLTLYIISATGKELKYVAVAQ